MKITFVFIALTALCISAIGQEKPRLITRTARSDAPPEYGTVPFAGSERFKLTFVPAKDTTYVTIYLFEYLNGKRIEKHEFFEYICTRLITKGQKLVFEMVPSTNRDDTMRVFVTFPDMMAARPLFAGKGKSYKYVPYNVQKEGNVLKDTDILMLFYEDDPKTNEVESTVKKYVKDGKLDTDPSVNNELLSKIERYAILFYKIRQ
ncbi:MAG: hypothetical protein LBL57_04950 [Tannerella sp.]|jgi:hypothetical protein|nr:hypothetical protein [Tannerella sp.]